MPRAEVNGVVLEYDTFGTKEGGEALVLINGLGQQMTSNCEEYCQRLSRAGPFYVIRFDNRDIGLSSRCADRGNPWLPVNWIKTQLGMDPWTAYTLDTMANDVFGLLDHLDIQRSHLVGNSMGSFIAQHAALQQPHRVLGLVPIMGSTQEPGLPKASPMLMLSLSKPRPVDPVAHAEHIVNIVRSIGSPEPHFNPDLIREAAKAAIDRCDDYSGSARHLAAIMHSEVNARERLTRLQTLAVPTTVVHGARDPLIHPDHGRAIARAIPDAEFVLVDEMGHDFPESFWDTVIEAIVCNAKRPRPGTKSPPK